MIICNARSKTGRIYPYFVCCGRNNKTTDCRFRAVPITTIEQKVESEYACPEHQLTAKQRQELVETLGEELTAANDNASRGEQRLERRRERLLAERGRLLRAHLADAVPLDLLKVEQTRIREQLDGIDVELAKTRTPRELIEQRLQQVLGLAADAQALYSTSNANGRRIVTPSAFSPHHRHRRRHRRSARRTVQHPDRCSSAGFK